MRRAIVLAAAMTVAAASARGNPTAERRAELLYLLRQDCGSCHGMSLRGGLGPSLESAALTGKPDRALVAAILDGVPGSPMPPWAFTITPAEAAWLVDALKRGIDSDAHR